MLAVPRVTARSIPCAADRLPAPERARLAMRALAERWRPALSRSSRRRAAPSQAEARAAALSEDVQSAFAYLPATLIGMIAGVAIVLWLFHAAAPAALLAPWLAAFALLWSLRLAMLRGYRRALRAGVVEWRRWQRV